MSNPEAEQADTELRRHAKSALRNQMRKVRAALPRAACEARSTAIEKRLRTLPELEAAGTVLGFSSIRNEASTRPFLEEMWRVAKTVALPRVDGKELRLHRVERDTQLVEGAFSVPEPPETAPEIGPAAIDFALVPALAVDARGYRIGYGGGYYDRLIPRLSRACTCVIAYDFQLIAEAPAESFDAPVDIVVTDERVLRVG